MIRLLDQPEAERIAHHQANPLRSYATDHVQAQRIALSRSMVAISMSKAKPENRAGRAVELGCGVGEITGHLCYHDERWYGVGVDCHWPSVLEANVRYAPAFTALMGKIERTSSSSPIDVLVMCEVLEHLNDAVGVALSWLQRARFSVISHPLDEPYGSTLSAGDHCWSFSEKDHLDLFAKGGHVTDQTEVFDQGAYRIIISRGHAA